MNENITIGSGGVVVVGGDINDDDGISLALSNEQGSCMVWLTPLEVERIYSALQARATIAAVPNREDRDAVAAVLARKRWRDAHGG